MHIVVVAGMHHGEGVDNVRQAHDQGGRDAHSLDYGGKVDTSWRW